MRLGLCLVPLVALGFAACSDEARLAEARSGLGCAPVEGIKAISGGNQPAYIVVGEFTETNEAPAAFAELACNLAASGERLFVGVSEYLGGATDAETKMRARLDALIAKGAPMTVGVIDDGSRPYDTRARTKSEKAWAGAIAGQMKASGAQRALLLVSHTDARNEAWPRSDRFAGYDPMPLHLDGEVLSLEIGGAPAPGLGAPTVRLYPEMTGGFAGQIALPALTRPGLELATASVGGAHGSFFRSSDPETDAVLGSNLSREEKIGRLTEIYYRELAFEAGSQRMRSEPTAADRFRTAARDLATRVVDLGESPARSTTPGGAPAQLPVEDQPPEIPAPIVDLPDFKAADPPN